MVKMKNKCLLFLSNTLYIVVFIFVIYLTLVSSKYNVISSDDMYEVCYNVCISLFDNFLGFVYHGRYISNIFVKLQFGFFDIHPIIWSRTYGAFIKGMFLCFIIYHLTDALFIFEKEKKLIQRIQQPILIFTCFILYFLGTFNKSSYMLYTAFYGFIFPFAFFFVFWNKFIYLYVTNIIPKRKEKILLLLLSFFIGISTEFTIFTTFSTLLILFIINLTKKNYTFFNLFKFTIPFFVSVPFYIFNPGFIYKAQQKGTLNGFRNMIETIQNSFNEYIYACKAVITNEFLLFIIPILLLLILTFFVKNNKNKIFFTEILISILSSTFFFYFLLIIAGRGPFNRLYVSHFDTNQQIKICFIYIIFILISFISKRIILKYSLILAFIFISLYTQMKAIRDICEIQNILCGKYTGFATKEESNKSYLNEMFLLHYISKDLKPIIFEDTYSNEFSEGYIQHIYKIPIYYVEYEKVKTFEEAYALYLKNGGEKLEKFEFNNKDFQKLKEKYSQ